MKVSHRLDVLKCFILYNQEGSIHFGFCFNELFQLLTIQLNQMKCTDYNIFTLQHFYIYMQIIKGVYMCVLSVLEFCHK